MLFDLTPLVETFGSFEIGATVSIGLGLLVGFISAFLGIGGGFIFTPYLHSVIHMTAAGAVATSMGQIPFMSLSGSIQYLIKGKVKIQAALWLLLGSLPSAQIVAYFIGNINNTSIGREVVWGDMTSADLFLLVQYGFFIGLMGIYNLHRSFRAETDSEKERTAILPEGPRRNLATFGAGIVFGAFSALLGIGGGFFAVPFFVYLCGFEPVEGVATSLFAIFVTSALTTLHYVLADEIYLGISMTIATGSVVGALVGSRFAIGVKQAYILRTLGVVQIVVLFAYLGLKIP